MENPFPPTSPRHKGTRHTANATSTPVGPSVHSQSHTEADLISQTKAPKLKTSRLRFLDSSYPGIRDLD
jgi:hypothetical protein